jgi:cullin 3
MYTLLGKVDTGHDLMRSQVHELINQLGDEMKDSLTQESQPATKGPQAPQKHQIMIQSLLSLHDKFSRILKQGFHGDKSFETTINGAFECVINKNAKVPEYLSLFMDECLRKSAKGVR